MSARQPRRGVFKNDADARAQWGRTYSAIPKSVFAQIAWHLANQLSGVADTPGAAEGVFLREWLALVPYGATKPPKWVEGILASGRPAEESDTDFHDKSAPTYVRDDKGYAYRVHNNTWTWVRLDGAASHAGYSSSELALERGPRGELEG